MDKTDERIARIYADASGKNASTFTALMHENNGKGRWLSPEEVIEKGLADKIIASGKIKNALRSLLGIENRRLPEPVETEIESVPEAPRNEADALEKEIREYENPEENAPAQEIADLQNRIAELEVLNAKLNARATQTSPKEDPTDREIKRQGNAAAYENDLQQFRNL